jgi:two-component system sensor histidine kinase DctS
MQDVLTAASPRWALLAFARLRSLWKRWFLWLILAVLVSALLVTVVWLAGRHEV